MGHQPWQLMKLTMTRHKKRMSTCPRLGANVGQVAPSVLAAFKQLIIGDERVRADRLTSAICFFSYRWVSRGLVRYCPLYCIVCPIGPTVLMK